VVSPQPTTVPTSSELLRLQDDAGVEFVNGQILEKPVSIRSGEIELAIGWALRNVAMRTGSARVYPATVGYRCFSDDPMKFRRPDVSVVRKDRMARVDPDEGFMPIPPDLAVEVVSPNDLVTDLEIKVEEYLSNGFPLVWVVEPATKTVTIHRGDGSLSRLHAKDEITGEAALPTFRCKVAEFFETIPAK
jgi:Uma2 family endonuclease